MAFRLEPYFIQQFNGIIVWEIIVETFVVIKKKIRQYIGMNEEHNQKAIVKNQVLKPLAESASIDELLLQLDNAKSRLSELAVAAIANQEYGI